MQAENRDKLGILGGMGPQATQVLYQWILDRTDADSDQEHVPAVILSDTSMPDRTEAILSGNTAEVKDRLIKDARLLQSCGCGCIAIPCNTSHYFWEDIQAAVDIPVLHMPRMAVEVLKEQGSVSFTDTMAVRPSLMSLPSRSGSLSLRSFTFLA